jgi:D-glycero-beta-D-manno-heptose-7-phosphate kinase
LNTDFLSLFGGANILVAGEVGIDEYIWGDTRRISPEAPVPVVEVESTSFHLGLAANVAENIVSVGGKATLLSVCGADADAEKLHQMVSGAGIQKSHFIEDPSRPTLRKVRIIAQKQHVVRVDYERCHALNASLVKQFSEVLYDLLPACDGVVLQDYGKGLWTPDTVSFIRYAREHKKPVFVDPSRSTPLSFYAGATLLSPNISEAEALTGFGQQRGYSGEEDGRLFRMAEHILRVTEADHAVITCGAMGMVSLTQGQSALQRIPTFAREVFDVTGAGDTVISILALMVVTGHPLDFCIKVANAAAGLVVGKIGTASVSSELLKVELERLLGLGLIK